MKTTNVNSFINEMDSKMATIDKIMTEKKKYAECNNTLPKELPYITKDEAVRAYKLLVRKFGRKQTRHPWKDKWMNRKMSVHRFEKNPRKCWVCLSGNPHGLHRGWRRLIHDVSHLVHRWLRPKAPHHCYQQADLELEMIKFVLQKDWLNGVLKTKVVVLTKDEKRQKKLKHYKDLINKWQRKQKLAITFIRKYNRRVKYLDGTK